MTGLQIAFWLYSAPLNAIIKIFCMMAENCDPHRDPHNEMRRKIQRAPERKPFPFRCSVCLWDLSNLCHETAHFLRGLLLHLPSGVGVGAECEARIIVAEHTADGFDVHAILQCQRCEGMSEMRPLAPPFRRLRRCTAASRGLPIVTECRNAAAEAPAAARHVCFSVQNTGRLSEPP